MDSDLPLIFPKPTLDGLAEQKAAKLAQRAEVRKQILGGQPAGQYVLDTPEAKLNRIGSLEDYLAKGNAFDPEVARYYDRRTTQNMLSAFKDYQEEKAARQEGNWARDEERGTALGTLKQGAALAGTMGARLADWAAASPVTGAVMGLQTQIPDAAQEAFRKKAIHNLLNRDQSQVITQQLAGQISPEEAQKRTDAIAARRAEAALTDEDQAILSAQAPAAPESGLVPGSALAAQNTYRPTYEELIQSTGEGAKIAKDLGTTLSSKMEPKINQLYRKDLDADLSESWDKNAGFFSAAKEAWDSDNVAEATGQAARGLAGLVVDGAGDLINNPTAAFEYMVENAPQLALGAYSKTLMTASNVAYGADIYAQALADYQQANDGAMPSKADAAEMMAWSMSAAAAESVAELAVLKNMGIGKKAISKTLEEQVAARLAQANKAFVRRVGESALEVGKQSLKSLGEEGLTETYQTAVENNLSRLNTDFNGEELFKAGVIGAAAGGGMTAGMTTLNELGEGRRNEQAAWSKALAERNVVETAYKNAVETGNVDELLQPGSKTYAPDRAAEALVSRLNREDVTEEEKTATLEKLQQIETSLSQDIESKDFSLSMQTPEARAKHLADLELRKQELETKKTDNTITPDEQAELSNWDRILEMEKDALDNASKITPKSQKQILAQKKATEQLLEKVQARRKNFEQTQLSQTQEAATVQSVDTQLDAVETEATPEAVSGLISTALRSPGSISAAQAERMAKLSGPEISEAQSRFLQGLARTRKGIDVGKGMDRVQENVLDSKDPEFIGLRQYMDNIAKYLNAGGELGARRSLEGLRKFARTHAQKADKIREVYQSLQPGERKYVRRNADGVWEEAASVTDQEVKAKQAYWVDNRSGNLVRATQHEATTLKQGLDTMNEAVALKFAPGGAVNQGTQVRTQPNTPPANQGTNTPPPPSNPNTPPPSNPNGQNGQDGQNTGTGTPPRDETPPPPSGDGKPPVTGENQNTEETGTREEGEGSEGAKATDGSLSFFERYVPDLKVTAENFTKVNLWAQMLTQSAGRAGAATLKPLVKVKDFIEALVRDPGMLNTYVSEWFMQTVPEDARKAVLRDFILTNRKWSAALDQLVVKDPREGQVEYFWSKPLQFALQENGKLDENMKTAISYALYSYIAEKAGEPTGSDDHIRKKLGLDENAHIPAQMKTVFQDVGNREHMVVADLGRKVAQVLGIKPRDKETYANMVPDFEIALGQVALRLGIQQGLLDVKGIENRLIDAFKSSWTEREAKLAAMAERTVEEARAEEQQVTRFVRVKQETKQSSSGTYSVPVARAKEISDRHIASRNFLTTLFGAEDTFRLPSHEPENFENQKVRNTDLNVPKVLEERLNQKAKQAHMLRPDMLKLWGMFSEEALASIAGIKSFEGKSQHALLAKARKARNDEVQRQLYNMQQFIDMYGGLAGAAEAMFYFLDFVGKPQRVFVDSSLVNRQLYKVHRHMISHASAPIMLRMDDAAKMEQFLLRIADGFENTSLVKSENTPFSTDKQANEKTQRDLAAVRANPRVQAAVRALRRVLHEASESSPAELTLEEQSALMDAVQVGGKNFHSLESLIALAALEHAQATKQEAFEVNLLGEVDGITNGPMLIQLLMGTATPEVLIKGGMFMQGSGLKDYPVWRGETGNRDLYEWVADAMEDFMKIKSAELPEVVAAVSAITGQITGKAARLQAKEALTPLIFGSSIKNTVAGMADLFIEKFYESIEKAIDNGGTVEEKNANLEQLRTAVNNLITYANANSKSKRKTPHIPKLTVDNALTFEVTGYQAKAMRKAYADTVGAALGDALDARFKTFLERRKQFNNAANMAFSLYNAAYNAAYQRKIEELVGAPLEVAPGDDDNMLENSKLPLVRRRDGKPILADIYALDVEGNRIRLKDENGNLLYDKNKKPLFKVIGKRRQLAADLPLSVIKEIEDSVKDLRPMVQTAMSTESQQRGTGLLAQSEDSDFSQDTAYTVYGLFNSTKTNKTYETPSNNAIRQALSEPGVAALILQMHSTDSAIASAAYSQLEALNLHDALGVRFDQLVDAAKILNKEAYRVLRDHSPSMALGDRLAANVKAFYARVKDGKLDDKMLAEIRTVAETFKKRLPPLDEGGAPDTELVSYFVLDFLQEAVRSEKDKLTLMANMEYMGQYGLEGGSYAITDEDRAIAKQRLEELEKYNPVSPQIRDMIKELDGIFKRALDSAPKREPKPEAPVQKQKTAQNTEDSKAVDKATLDRDAKRRRLHWYTMRRLMAAATTPENNKKVIQKVMDHIAKTKDGLTTAVRKVVSPDVQDRLVAQIENLSQVLEGRLTKLGLLGKSPLPHDADLVQWFESQKGPTTAKELFRFLHGHLGKQNTRISKFQDEFLRQLMRSLPADMPIEMVVPFGELPSYEKDLSNALAWYHSGEKKIYVKSPAFFASSVTPEILLHEMTHAALNSIIAAVRADPKHPAAATVKKLEQLMQQAKAFAKSRNLDEKYASVFSKLEEFVAYGMTDYEFQKEILTQFEAKGLQPTKTAKIYKAMQAFIELAGQLLFGDKADARINSGLSLMIANTAMLLEVAATSEQKAINELPEISPATARGLDTEQLFDALDQRATSSLDPVLKGRLTDLLSGIVGKVLDPYRAYDAAQALDPSADPIDNWLTSLASGQRPYISEATVRLNLQPQVAYVMEMVEATFNTVFKTAMNQENVRAIYKDAVRIWQEARNEIGPDKIHEALNQTPWSTAQPHERQAAKDLHTFLFSRVDQNADGTNEAASRFMALIMTVPEFSKLARFESYRSTTKKKWKDMGWGERAMALFTRLLGIMSGHSLRGYEGQMAIEQVRQLADQLVGIQTRYRIRVNNTSLGAVEKLENGIKGLRDAAQGKIAVGAEKLSQSGAVPAAIRELAKVTHTVADKRVEAFIQAARDARDWSKKKAPGVIAGTIDTMRGIQVPEFHRLLLQAKRSEVVRKEYKENTGKLVMESFDQEGKNLSELDHRRISKFVTRTDVASLLDRYSLDQIRDLFHNEVYLKQQIRQLSNGLQVANPQLKAFYLESVEALGEFMITGIANRYQYRNAYVLSRAFGTALQSQVTAEEAAAVEPELEMLATLHALLKTNPADRAGVANLMTQEIARNGPNGFEVLLKMHRLLQTESLTGLFRGNKTQMIKGYTPEMYDPHTEITVADLVRGAELEAKGWKKGQAVRMDPTDPNIGNYQGQLHMYVLRDRGFLHLVSGAFSYTNRQNKGQTISHNITSLVTGMPHMQAMRTINGVTAAKAADIAAIGTGIRRPNTDNNLVPVFDEDGNIANWTYVMRESVKDTTLKRDHHIGRTMGALAASIYDKMESLEQNRDVVEALHDQYRLDGPRRPGSYLEIGPQSRNRELRELWNQLPAEARAHATQLANGHQRLFVRSDLLYPVFGYRKLSITNMFDKLSRAEAAADPTYRGEVRSLAEDLLVAMLESVPGLGKKAALRLRRAEDLWQELVHITKDFIVVKTGTVLVWNVVSNIGQLLWQGVPFMDVIRHSRTALIGAMDYRKHHKDLQRLRLLRDGQVVQGPALDEVEREIAVLEDLLATNPVGELIEQGLLPSIVEDVSLDDEQDTYVSKLQKRLDPYVAKVPSPLRTAGRVMFVTHDTPLYRALSMGTQYSDFMARYALYQHLTTRQQDPMSKADAVIRVSEDFVNYDIPDHPLIQAMNDNGLLYFTKYYLRIQRTILRNWEERPARALLMILENNYISGMQTILDSLPSFGNPLETGAFKLLEVWDDTLPMKLLTSLWR